MDKTTKHVDKLQIQTNLIETEKLSKTQFNQEY